MSILHRKLTINIIRDQYRNKTTTVLFFLIIIKCRKTFIIVHIYFYYSIQCDIFFSFSIFISCIAHKYLLMFILLILVLALYQNNNKYHVFYEQYNSWKARTTKKIKKKTYQYQSHISPLYCYYKL